MGLASMLKNGAGVGFTPIPKWGCHPQIPLFLRVTIFMASNLIIAYDWYRVGEILSFQQIFYGEFQTVDFSLRWAVHLEKT